MNNPNKVIFALLSRSILSALQMQTKAEVLVVCDYLINETQKMREQIKSKGIDDDLLVDWVLDKKDKIDGVIRTKNHSLKFSCWLKNGEMFSNFG